MKGWQYGLLLMSISLYLFGIPATTADAQTANHPRDAATTSLYLPEIANAYQAFDGMRLTFDSFRNTEPALAPDNSLLVYISERAGQQDVYSVPQQGGTPLNLSNTPTAQEETPVFSPDGATIAFASNRSGDWDIYLMDRQGGHVQLAIGNPGTDEIQPAFLPDGAHILFSSNRADGNWDIYSATISSTFWSRLTTGPESERFPTVSADGSTIAFRREGQQPGVAPNSEIYTMQADGSAMQQVTNNPAFDGYPVVAADGSGLVFMSDRAGALNLFTMNLGGGAVQSAWEPAGWTVQTPRLTVDGQSLLFAGGADATADIYMRAYASPLVLVGQRGFAELHGQCGWEAGVLAYGWAKVWRKTHQQVYWQWLKSWVDGCLAGNPTVQHVNDGLLGYAALVVYAEKPDSNYLAFAQRVADYLLHTAPRTTDGTLTHFGSSVWDDTLIGVVPFLTEMSQITKQQSYLDEAVAQVLKHAAHLQDAQTGLYHHAWDESEQRYLSAVYWCRGNAWMLLADIEVLSALPTLHPQRAAILTLLQRQGAALKALQNGSGLWHTVVDHPDFYLETSGSAMIAAALLESSNQGWLNPQDFGATAQLARMGVWRQSTADGAILHVSGPTGPMLNATDYNAIPAVTLQLYGQGAVLLMGAQNAG